jgi:plasmid stabilization system protein ParE
MEAQKRSVILSTSAEHDIQDIFIYGVETFGVNAAEMFKADLVSMIRALESFYEIHPECRHIPTKSRMYRNIILGSYLVIYRITPNRIEVLKAISSRMRISKIRASRKIKV